MNETIISVEHIGKKYIIRHQSSCEEFWALKDVCFEVNRGDRIGIIGRNGAGKSTLLKLLSRITYPTTGKIMVKGRISSLLEIGTGFHPELTGRENIYLSGAILGMTKAEIKKNFNEIVAFSEIEKFLDTPVKRFSSGMYVRLAFAVMAYLESDILLIDEVLAVGDARFQKKCLGKMEEVSNKEGRTVLFVSHNLEAIQDLCSKAVLLQDGKILSEGNTKDVVRKYISQYNSGQRMKDWKDVDRAPGNESAKLLKVEIIAMNNESNVITVGTPFNFEFTFMNMLPGKSNIDITYHLYNEMGIMVFVGSSAFSKELLFNPGLIKARCYVPADLLNEGTYTIKRLLLVKDKGSIIYEHKDALIFDIVSLGAGRLGWHGAKEGVVKPKLKWDLFALTGQNVSMTEEK